MRSAAPHIVPVMLYDGDCGFCAQWVSRWRKTTGVRIRYEPYQRALKDFPIVSEAQCRQAVQLIMPDGQVFSGARAVLEALAGVGHYRFLRTLYLRSSLFARAAEAVYQWVAHRRAWFSKLVGARECRV